MIQPSETTPVGFRVSQALRSNGQHQLAEEFDSSALRAIFNIQRACRSDATRLVPLQPTAQCIGQCGGQCTSQGTAQCNAQGTTQHSAPSSHATEQILIANVSGTELALLKKVFALLKIVRAIKQAIQIKTATQTTRTTHLAWVEQGCDVKSRIKKQAASPTAIHTSTTAMTTTANDSRHSSPQQAGRTYSSNGTNCNNASD